MSNVVYPKIEKVTASSNYGLTLEFSNGEKKFYDFKPNLMHKYYRELENILLFKCISVNDGEIEWSTGQDFCPHTLYDKSTLIQ